MAWFEWGAQRLVYSIDTPIPSSGQFLSAEWGLEPYFGTVLIDAHHSQGFPVSYSVVDLVT